MNALSAQILQSGRIAGVLALHRGQASRSRPPGANHYQVSVKAYRHFYDPPPHQTNMESRPERGNLTP